MLRGKANRAAGAAPCGVDDGQLYEPDTFGLPIDWPARQVERERSPVDQPLHRPLASGRLERQLFAVPFDQRSVGWIDNPRAAGLRWIWRERARIEPLESRRQSIPADQKGPGRWRRGGAGRRRTQEVCDLEQNRCGGQPAAAAGHRRAVRPPGPDADGHLRVVADRPEIAVTIGRPGLEGEPAATPDLGWQNAGRRWRLGQDVVDVPGGELPEDRGSRVRRIARAIAQRRHLAGVRQRRIEPYEVGEGDPGAAECYRQARLDGRFRQPQSDARGPKSGDKPTRTEPVENCDSREVQRIL